MKTLIPSLFALLAMTFAAPAQINRIKDGGQYVEISDTMNADEPAVFVFYTQWEQASINLLEEIESWASDYPDLDIFFIDCVDQRTQVYRQFSLQKIPSIVVYDEEEEQVDSAVYSVRDLEDLLKSNDLID